MKIDVCKIFNSNIKFVEYSRSGVVYYTDSLDELYELKGMGWKFNVCNLGYRVVPPSVTICDITECKKVEQYKNVILNLAYFKFLISLKEKCQLESFIHRIIDMDKVYYKNFLFHVSYSPILEFEIKIEGIDQRLYRLKQDMLKEFVNLKDYETNYRYYKNKISKNKLFLKEIETNDKVIDYYNTLMEKNSIIKKIHISTEKYKVNIDLIEELEYDILLFLPYGCYKFLNLFINQNNYHKAMFWEIHIDQNKPTIHKLYEKDIQNKKVLIVDSVYSGKTLLYVKKKIESLGGMPILLGVYPKSRSVINILDYVLLLNKVYRCDELDLNDKNLFEHLYINACKG